MEPNSYPIETFDPLLRDLAYWGLATRSETARGSSWRLVDAAQHRLNELVRTAGPVAVESVLYLDHWCERCHDHGPTRLREGRYLCDACFGCQVAAAHQDAEPEATVVTRRWHLRRHGTRNEGALAS